jgi:hypothetical protein
MNLYDPLTEGKQDNFMEKRGYYIAVHNNSKLPMTRYEGVLAPVDMATSKSKLKSVFTSILPFQKIKVIEFCLVST